MVNNLFIYFRCGATSWDMSYIAGLSLKNDVFNSRIHQLTFEYLEDSSGTSFVILFYLDGQLVATSTAFPTTDGNPFVAKATAGKAKIGCPSGYTGKTFAGDFRRAWFQNAELSDRPVIDLVKLDWDVNKKRMGAA
ncbi:hypothetical protein BJF92_23460 [Rhizobium rhizosphaerae]|uniref:Uncharacterized protein n=1 Tax=Xaviernesmea rhizosphaerae TaxID=1672749 RepID=A0A1Q9AQI1_9HYPH|nr:hypothetical protein [Xaviernesmea rhizosphaerae]OLP57697.1 hypothetical protein BJF92_23460 [Xaviernesmea rhizosphaerae]